MGRGMESQDGGWVDGGPSGVWWELSPSVPPSPDVRSKWPSSRGAALLSRARFSPTVAVRGNR